VYYFAAYWQRKIIKAGTVFQSARAEKIFCINFLWLAYIWSFTFTENIRTGYVALSDFWQILFHTKFLLLTCRRFGVLRDIGEGQREREGGV